MSDIVIQPGQSIQSVLDGLDYTESIRSPFQIRLARGVHETTSPIVITKRVDIDARGATIVCNHNGNGVFVGSDQREPYFMSWVGGRITTRSGYSEARALVVNKANFASFTRLQVDRFQVGFACEGTDPVDVSFTDCYSNGCAVGYIIIGGNVVSVSGGKVVGDTTRFPECVGLVIQKSASVTIHNVDCSILGGGAIHAVDCSALSISSLYTERIGLRTPLNDSSVVKLKSCNQVDISGLINAVGGPSGTPNDCATGIRLIDCHGVTAKCLFLSCREQEVFASNSTRINLDGSTAQLPWCTYFEPRLRSVPSVFNRMPLPASYQFASKWDGINLEVKSNESKVSYSIPVAYTVGKRYRFSVALECLTKGDSTSGRAAIRLIVGNGSDRSVRDFPLAVGIPITATCDWTATKSGESFECVICNRANPIGQTVWANWSAEVYTIGLFEVVE